MRPGVNANQRDVCRFDENAQWCRLQLTSVGMIQIREITVLITAPKGGLLGEEPNVSPLVRHVRLHLFASAQAAAPLRG